MSCFAPDANGTDVVEFEGPLEDAHLLLLVHRLLNYPLCGCALAMNVVVSSIILRSRTDVCQMRPILLLNSVVDAVWAALLLLTCKFNFNGHQRYFTYSNAPYSFDRETAAVLSAVEVAFMVLSWDLIPIQFLYRFLLIKHGRPPRGWRLFAFVGGCTLGAGLHVYSAFSLFVFRPWNERFQADAETIFRHYGYAVDRQQIFGVVVGTSTRSSFNALRPFAFVVLNLSVVVWTTASVRAHLKRGAISPHMRRLHAYVQRMLFSLAAVLFVAIVMPTVISSTTALRCTHHTSLNFAVSLIILAEALASPCITVYFVRPYRDDFKRLVGFATAVAHFAENSEQATKTVLAAPAPSAADPFPEVPQALEESRV